MKIIVMEHPRIPSGTHFNDIANTPLWSSVMGGYAAAVLSARGHHAAYLDAICEKMDFSAARERIMAKQPNLLAVNAVYFWEHTPHLFTFLSELKADGFDGHINLFGFFPTLVFESLLHSFRSVDSVTVGECEHTIGELAEALAKGKGVGSVAGLAVRDRSEKITYTPRPPEKDPDRFPFPVRLHGPELTAGILASRGCYNHCSFCPVPPFYNGGALWRGRSPENIFSEIRVLKEKGFEEFYFLDPNFIGPGNNGRRRAFQLSALLAPLKIRFGMETRPDDLDPELLAALRSAGLNSLLLGVESASAGMLETIRKSVSADTAVKAIAHCREVGIEPEIGFLMFLPDSRLADIRENYEFLLRNHLLDRLDRTVNVLSHRHIVLKGTTGYQTYQQQGRLTPAGMLGFEGNVSHTHPKVERLAHEVTRMCSRVLHEMSRPDSPVYWKTGPCDAWTRKNREVLVEFERLLVRAE